MDIIFLKPVYKDYIWGGTRLKKEFNKNTPYEKTAESWEVSTNKNGKSIIINGEWKDKDLDELFNNQETKESIFGKRCLQMEKFPLLIKFIDAEDNLSVQVHPNDEFAKRYENDSGKTEMWYILDCKENAKLICGLNENAKKENIKEILKNGEIKKYLKYVDVQKGDSIYIPSGTVHAILSGILICEIQQNSDLTYRIYDWDRVGKDGKPRELHIDKAIDVIDFNSKAEKIESNGQNVQEIMKTKYFNVDKIKIEDIYTDISNIDTFYAISITDGSGKIYYENKEFNIKKGDSFIVPAKLGEYKIEGKIELLKSYIS